MKKILIMLAALSLLSACQNPVDAAFDRAENLVSNSIEQAQGSVDDITNQAKEAEKKINAETEKAKARAEALQNEVDNAVSNNS